MNGTILGRLNGKVIYQDNDTKPNRNVFVVGGPGSYKTQSVVITNVLNETENSIVTTDPKGEVYEKTAGIKEKQGYEVHVLNYTDMAHSSRQNPLDYVTKDIHATEVATKIVDSANKDGKKDVWYYSQRALLRALILYVIHEMPPEDRNFRGITDFLQNYDVEKDTDGISELDHEFQKLDRRHPARRAYELGFKKSRGDMQGSIIVSLLTTIADFVDDEVAEFTSFSDFHLKDIGRKKIALYVIIPVMDNAFEGLINLFFSQLFSQLYDLGAENGSKLPRNVDFVLDEFVNLGKFPNFEEFLATCRGYGIGVMTICQTITQLEDKYNKEKAESILGNHNIKICLTASNKRTADYFSGLLGKTTVKVETENKSKTKSREGSKSIGEGVNYSARNLMNSDEIMRLPSDTSLIIFANRKPIKAKKALQWELFPGVVDWFPKRQREYQPVTSEAQLRRLREAEEQFQQKIENRKEQYQAEETSEDLIDLLEEHHLMD
ncbi:VirD4-like conjugal transfer protein, CD1115 family [Streptococcus ferus]|uniref:VirD4-like conjugal transfer protein, CD1115 family n=1 Tax=Streptococcus ferus TaxID=1345 RepID=UPI0035A09B80